MPEQQSCGKDRGRLSDEGDAMTKAVDATCEVCELPTIEQLGTREFVTLLASRIGMEWCERLHCLPVARGWVYVIGDPENGRYEWAFQVEQHSLHFSNAAYGAIADAMRDGLIVATGGITGGTCMDRIWF